MADSGLMEIGSHTHTHTIVTLHGAEAARDELSRSKALVEKNVQRRCDLFCYPNGDFDDFSADTARLLKETGYLCGLTTVAGFATPGSDPSSCDASALTTATPSKFRMTFSPAVTSLSRPPPPSPSKS
jgi:peptidoglycan/xylan/chitin deacetylase (PgdA/CDA1 family)